MTDRAAPRPSSLAIGPALGLSLLFLAACVVIGLWLRSAFVPDWFASPTIAVDEAHADGAFGVVYNQIDGDGYARLARVHRILDTGELIQRVHPDENWPDGMPTTTTLPLDALILVLYAGLGLISTQPLDLAGALVSPIIAVALLAWLWWWCRRVNADRWSTALLLGGVATLPPIVLATAFGRADHQSLVLALIALALSIEWLRWVHGHESGADSARSAGAATAAARWSWTAGIVWGVAFWTSLYEPSLVFGTVVLLNLLLRWREQWRFLAGWAITVAIAFAIERPSLTAPETEYWHYLDNWLGTVAEQAPMLTLDGFDFARFNAYFSPAVWLVPVIVIWLSINWRQLNATERALLPLSAFLLLCTLAQQRWISYASLSLLLLTFVWFRLLARKSRDAGSRVLINLYRGAFLLLAAAGIAWACWENVRLARPNLPHADLRKIANTIRQAEAHTQAHTQRQNQNQLPVGAATESTPNSNGIIAPYWLSPSLLYYTGNPVVTSTSHRAMPGIVDSARFFAGYGGESALAILRQRRVRWVVLDHPPAVVTLSRTILGKEAPQRPRLGDPRPLAFRLAGSTPFPTQTNLRLRASSGRLQLFEFVDTN